MSTYQGATRTNFFRVNDEEKFLQFMKHVLAADGKVDVFEKEKNGVLHFAFGCYGSITGVDVQEYCRACKFEYGPNDEKFDEDDYAENRYDVFITMLRSMVAEDDAIIIMEAGHEKLRYITSVAEVITRGSYECLDMRELACEKAKLMLGRADWSTETSY